MVSRHFRDVEVGEWTLCRWLRARETYTHGGSVGLGSSVWKHQLVVAEWKKKKKEMD